METQILKHNGVPCLNIRENTNSFLVVNGHVDVENQHEDGASFSVRARDAALGMFAVDENPGNSLRAVNNNQANNYLAVWEDVLPGIDVLLVLTSSNTTENEVWLTVQLINRWNGVSYYGRFTELVINTTRPLTNLLSNVFTFRSNGHYFFLLTDFGSVKRNLLVDVFPSNATVVNNLSTLRITDAGYTRLNRNFIITRPGAYEQQQILKRDVVSYADLTGYFTPSIAGVADLQSYNVQLNSPLTGVSVGDNVTIMSYACAYLADSYYYPVTSRATSLTLPAGDTALRVPDELASLYFLEENRNPGFLFSFAPWGDQDTRAGLRVSQGVPVGEYHTFVATPQTPQLPTTPTNNVFPKGFSFVQWLQAKSSPFRFDLQRIRMIPRVSPTESVYVFGQAGHPHVRIGNGSVSNNQAYFDIAPNDYPLAGVITDNTASCLNPATGAFLTYMQVSKGLNDTPAVAQLPWIPFTNKGRCIISTPGLNYLTPIFGIRQEKISRFLDMGDGRLGAVVDNELYVCSPVATNPEFPYFLDFQVRVNAVGGLNAEVYNLNTKVINAATATQTGYLVATDSGLLSINKLSGLIDRVVNEPCLSVFFNAGYYVALHDLAYTVLQYQEEQKQFVVVKRGDIHPELMDIITRNTFTIARNLRRNYIDSSNKVIAFRPTGTVVYLDQYNVLHVDQHAALDFSFAGRYVAYQFNASTPDNRRIHPFPSYMDINPTGNGVDRVANTVATTITKADLNINDNLSFYKQVYTIPVEINFDTLQQINASDPIVVAGNAYRTFRCMVITNLKHTHPEPGDNERGLIVDQKHVSFRYSAPSLTTASPQYLTFTQSLYMDKQSVGQPQSSFNYQAPQNIDSVATVVLRNAHSKSSSCITMNGRLQELTRNYTPRLSKRHNR